MSKSVRAEMVTLLYQHTPAAILGTSVAVFITCIVFSGMIPTRILLLWSVAMMGVLLWRYTYYTRFQRTPKPDRETSPWESLAMIGAGTTGLCLGAGGVVIATHVTPFYQGAILLLVLGVVISAIPFLGAVRKVYFSSVGAALPIVVWCVKNWEPVYVSTGVMVGVFIWAAWTTSTKYGLSIESVIRTRYELSEVTGAKDALQRSYEKLASVEQEVRNSEERFRGIFEGGLFGMAMLSNDGSVQRVNHALCRLLGYEDHELIGRRYGELVHPSCLAGVNDFFQSVADGNVMGYQHESQYQHKDGHDIYGLEALTAIRGDTGDVLGIVVQAQDIFGSGLSSFKYLKQFPFDFLKIDGSLIHEIAEDSNDYAMVRAIQQLTASSGLVCVAEWICNENVAELLKALGVEYGQGFIYGKPFPIENIKHSFQSQAQGS